MIRSFMIRSLTIRSLIIQPLCWVFVASLGVLQARAVAAPTTALSNHRVLIISVDGLRPDLLLRGDTPTLHGMIAKGAFTMWAQTTAVAVTIPSHVSMLTGARPQVHQIEWNHEIPLSRQVYPAVPTIFELAHKAGFSTGIVVGKGKFDVLLKPGTVDVNYIPTADVVVDREVLAHALQIINDNPPQVLFVHFGENDKVGHALGWGSPAQMEAIHNVDTAIGTLLETLKVKGLLDNTLVIVSADHGGAGKQHGADDVRSRCIPWIAMGPGVRPGVDLTTIADTRTVRTEDTFATACNFLGIAVDPKLDGKPVAEIYNRTGQEILADAPPNPTPGPAPVAAISPVPAAPVPTSPVSAAAVRVVPVPVAPAPVASVPVSPATQPAASEYLARPHAVLQTQALSEAGDAADDPAVWVNPKDSALSLIIGTDKKAGLCVYDMDGRLLQSVSPDTHPDNVDVLYGFEIDGKKTDLTIAGTRAPGKAGVKVWAIDADQRSLRDVTAGGVTTGNVIPAFGGTEPYGSCVYHSPKDGGFYYFVNNKRGRVEQYRLMPAADGKISAQRVREFGVATQVEGCVCDTKTGAFYLAEEDVGIWKFSAEVDGGTEGKQIAKVGEHGLTADVEGLTIYDGPGNTGYLIASSQGSNTFKIYERGGVNSFVGTIDPLADQKIDGVSSTDGVDAVSVPVGKDFPNGLLVVQDGETPDGRQNFKVYDWRDIAGNTLVKAGSDATALQSPNTASR